VVYALIGGTGVEHLSLEKFRTELIDTPYGSVSCDIGFWGEKEIVFLRRHGKDHRVPPHKINYRANIWALKEIGVKKILSTCAVGSISDRFKVGEILLPDQFLDFTKSRIATFFEGGENGVLHVDVTEPYCPSMRKIISKAAREMNLKITNGGVYVCTEGPRFETPAEIKMFGILGGEIVGMTGVPEVILARELGMCYASIGLVTNIASGIAGQPLTHVEVIGTMNSMKKIVAKLINNTLGLLSPEQHECRCVSGSGEADMF